MNKQGIRYVEETNGQITFDGSSKRYTGRELYEDKVQYNPHVKEPRLYTLVHNPLGDVRINGKWDKERVLGEYPCATGFTWIERSSGAVYKHNVIR